MRPTLKSLVLTAAGLTLVIFTGCSSIVNGRHQAVSFKSEPDGATITVAGQIGKTPTTLQLDRKSGDQVVIVEKEGYKTETFQLKSEINGWFFGNIIFGGLYGSTTDSLTGAAFKYSQDMFYVNLKPLGANAVPAHAEIKTFVVANYKSILEELTARTGADTIRNHQTTEAPKPYLKALFMLMKIEPENQGDYVVKVRFLADTYKDIVDFADKVADLAL